jgi:transposase
MQVFTQENKENEEWVCFDLTDTDWEVEITAILSPEMKKKIFDKAFKEHAVNLWLGSGKSAREIAAELGIKPDRLYTWKQALAPVPSSPGGTGARRRRPEELESELARLQRENQYLRQQRDILKKTLGILSEDPNSATNGSK